MVEYNSFTSHIQVTDDNGVNLPSSKASPTSTTPASVYIESDYHLLTPSFGGGVEADVIRVVIIIQETAALTNICFNVTLTASPNITIQVGPLANAWKSLSGVENGVDLGAIQSSMRTGRKSCWCQKKFRQRQERRRTMYHPIRESQRHAVFGRLNHLCRLPTHHSQYWGATCSLDGFKYHEGASAGGLLCSAASPESPMDFGDWLEITAGDRFKWLKEAYDEVVRFVVAVADDIYHPQVQTMLWAITIML